jgi:DNA-binding NarL/FixJ family response regulator
LSQEAPVAQVILIDSVASRAREIAGFFDEIPGLSVTVASEGLATVLMVRDEQPEVVFVSVDPDASLVPILSSVLQSGRILAYTSNWSPFVEQKVIAEGAKALLSDSDPRSSYLSAVVQALRLAA